MEAAAERGENHEGKQRKRNTVTDYTRIPVHLTDDHWNVEMKEGEKLFVKVKYFNEEIGGYAGVQYTYKTNLALTEYMKVLAPVRGRDGIEMKKALVTEINVPEWEVNPEWELKEIKEYDNGEG